jgi:hypothetical protein
VKVRQNLFEIKLLNGGVEFFDNLSNWDDHRLSAKVLYS